MNKNYTYYLTLFTVPFIAFIVLSVSGGRNGQYSGSPGDGGQTCTACHSGGDFGAVPEITSNIPTSGFVYGDTYEVTVSVTSSSTKHGFQLTTEDASNSTVGTYTEGTGSQIVNSGTHMTHTGPGNQQNSWTFDWTAPTFADGSEITFYAAVNATNANGSTSGDQVITTSTSYSLDTAGVDDIERITFSVFPNPSYDYINLDIDESYFPKGNLNISNSIGQVVVNKNIISNRIDVSHLESGVYFVRLNSNNRVATSRFIKE